MHIEALVMQFDSHSRKVAPQVNDLYNGQQWNLTYLNIRIEDTTLS